MRKALIFATSALGLCAVAALPASAIDCEGNFQIQKNGNLISTPYCQDGYLAIVAGEYGMYVSAKAIRYNPSVKERICRFIGYDNRVQTTCAPYIDYGRNRRWH